MNWRHVQHADDRNLLMRVCLASMPKCSYQMMLYKRRTTKGTLTNEKAMQKYFEGLLPNKTSRE
jgi:hypothetical protein